MKHCLWDLFKQHLIEGEYKLCIFHSLRFGLWKGFVFTGSFCIRGLIFNHVLVLKIYIYFECIIIPLLARRICHVHETHPSLSLLVTCPGKTCLPGRPWPEPVFVVFLLNLRLHTHLAAGVGRDWSIVGGGRRRRRPGLWRTRPFQRNRKLWRKVGFGWGRSSTHTHTQTRTCTHTRAIAICVPKSRHSKPRTCLAVWEGRRATRPF
jgi:hypothetical protein